MNTLQKLSALVVTPATLGALAAAMLFALPDVAVGQNALGGGDALDANINRVTGRSNLPAATPDFRRRNLTVTGDVAGGRAFRGDVGYTAEGDFRGVLGGDDLFRFRADSALSSPAVISSMPDQFRFGQHLGELEFRRSTAYAPRTMPDGQARSWDVSDGPILDRLRMDQITRSATGTERHLLSTGRRTVGTMRDREGRPYLIEASPLSGIGFAPAEERAALEGLTPFDRMRLREDLASGRVASYGSPYELRFEQLLEPDRSSQPRMSDLDRRLPEFAPDSQRDDRRIVDSREPQPFGPDVDLRERDRLSAIDDPTTMRDARHQQIIERIARRYSDGSNVNVDIDPQVLRELDQEFGRLREELTRRNQRVPAPMQPVPGSDEQDEQEVPDPDAPEQTRPTVPGVEIDPTVTVPMLRHGQRVEQLSGTERTRFNELMQSAEQNLRDGEYFIAERQFLRALRFHPGEPLATAGMAHAQMGAGLHIAASLTLQRLFATNPEMIDVRYDEALLPNRARLVEVVSSLQERLDEQRDREAVAFLLAYVGHQLEDATLVERGLSIMNETRPSDDLLLNLLKGVWLQEQPAEK